MRTNTERKRPDSEFILMLMSAVSLTLLLTVELLPELFAKETVHRRKIMPLVLEVYQDMFKEGTKL